MMKSKPSNISKLHLVSFFLIFLFGGISCNGAIADPIFIPTQEDLIPYYNVENSVLVASPGRSGTVMLTERVCECASSGWIILNTHILPPLKSYRGKILYIFSNPDKSAESVFHCMINSDEWGVIHFRHLESSDKEWLKAIEGTTQQTVEHNLLAYDALGCSRHLYCWLYSRTVPCDRNHAQILAVKYENLWESATQQAIRDFLSFDGFTLPSYRARGVKLDQLSDKERLFKTLFNRGTEDEPRYQAYDEARWFWDNASPFQFLQIN